MNASRAVCLSFLLALMASFTLTLFVGAAQAQGCASGAVPCFQGLGTTFTAAAVNSNAVVAGSALTSPPVGRAATWASGTITSLGSMPSCKSPCSSGATGISASGSVVVGSGIDANGNTQAARWVNGVVGGLGYLPGCTGSCSTEATGISSDSSTVVGSGTTSNLTEAFSWSNGSLTVLQAPPATPPCAQNGGLVFCNYQANAVNSTGSVVVGWIEQISGLQPVIWTNGTPSLLVAQCFEGFCGNNGATGVNSDSSVIIGSGGVKCYIGFCGTSEAARWVNGTFNFIGFPGTCTSDSCFSEANGVSADGVTVVGTGSVGAGNLALVWTPTIGMQLVQTILTSCGGINTTGWTLTNAVAISADGKTIVGTGVDPNGATESWIARLQFSLCSAVLPTVTGISPKRGLPTGGTTVSITGTNFAGVTSVKFGATAATAFTVNSPTSITATSPAGYRAVDVTISTTSGTSATGAADQFTFLPAAHDFNGDGKSDIAWRDTAGDAGLWLMNGSQILQTGVVGNLPNVWAIVGQRDFNGDGNADFLWRDTTGDVSIWLMNGLNLSSISSFNGAPVNWSVAGTGDFNGDGKGDILWRDAAGDIVIWFLNGTSNPITSTVGNVSTNWVIAGADMNGEIFWRNNATGEVGIWVMNGGQVAQTVDFGVVPLDWTIDGLGDFDGNGSTDILWRDSSGNVGLWLMNGTQIMSTAVLGNVSANWSIAETGDYNGDSKTDILWIDKLGNVGTWFMNDASISSTTIYGNVGTAWSVQSLNAD
jgi:probable HAF family extracellular repeat protein